MAGVLLISLDLVLKPVPFISDPQITPQSVIWATASLLPSWCAKAHHPGFARPQAA